MAKTSLPPGFRFHPTDVELIVYYLKRKVIGRKLRLEAIAEVDIYKYAPWDLPDKSCLRGGDLKWYFFCPRGKKYANGARTNRATDFGYWKSTGKDRAVNYNNEVVGMIRTLVFHRGKAPHGDRTDWVMHEYRICDPGLSERGIVQDAYVLCTVFQKDGRGPRNGAQYGAPFREEDWENDEDADYGDVVSFPVLPPPVPNQISVVAGSSHSEKHDNVHDANIEASPHLDGVDIYGDLGDLGSLGGWTGCGYDFFSGDNDYYDPNIRSLGDNVPFIELDDLDAPLDCATEAGEPELLHSNGSCTDQKCYKSEQLCNKVDPCFSQSPPMLPQDHSVHGHANEAPLNNGAAKLSKQSSVGSNCASEDLRNGNGSHSPR